MRRGRWNGRKGTVGQRERMKESRHDPYRARQKWPDPTRCTECGAVFTNGRWTWEQASGTVHQTTCPACRRTADDYPAGIVELGGEFLAEHREEIVNLLRNLEFQEKDGHPMERIMAVQKSDQGMVVTTTGIHLARRLGDGLRSAYKGDLSLHYAEGDERVRIQWRRE